MLRPITLLLPLAFASTSFALPPGAAKRGLREGANHHIGDASFIAKVGRAPDRRDSEAVRMRLHFQYIRDQLAAKPATKPELVKQRAKLLAYLDEYIAKGTTPDNAHLPWRTPVFIDDAGTICAVGYLIERSEGRALPEKIAASHRYDFIEDIAVAMPEVRKWVEESGLTLEEISSIQPGYIEPEVESWKRWTVQIKDGAYNDALEHGTTAGMFAKGKMTGTWTRRDEAGHVIGSGDFVRGKAMWHSTYRDGKPMAEGPFVANDPHGTWTFFHPSGNIAAQGDFKHGYRTGAWKFFHDTKDKTPIAIGRFSAGSITGTWTHFDAAGKLLATSTELATGNRDGYSRTLAIVPGSDRVRHEIHTYGGVNTSQLHALFDGVERLYVSNDKTYDADGKLLTETEGGWEATDCGWSEKRKRIAQLGNVTTLHALIDGDRIEGDLRECAGTKTLVSAERGAHLHAMLATMTAVRSQTPDFVKQLALGEREIPAATADADSADSADESEPMPGFEYSYESADLTRVLAATMTWYVEWPHIDGRFVQLFHTLPGHATADTWESLRYAVEQAAETEAAAVVTTLVSMVN